MKLGELLRAERERRSMNQQALASSAGISLRRLSDIENGANLGVGMLRKLIAAMDIRVCLSASDEVALVREDAAPTYSDPIRRLAEAAEGIPIEGLERVTALARWLTNAINDRGVSNTTGRETPRSDTPPTSTSNIKAFPEHTMPQWTPEFPVHPKEFKDAGETDYPLFLHGFEQEDIDAAAGVAGFDNDQMGTTLLNSKEVRSEKIRTVRVRGDSMSPRYEDGWKLAVDVTQKEPQNRQPVLVYRKDEGMMLGYYFKRGERARLLKQNKSYHAVELDRDDMIVGVISYVAWKPEGLAGPDVVDDEETAKVRRK